MGRLEDLSRRGRLSDYSRRFRVDFSYVSLVCRGLIEAKGERSWETGWSASKGSSMFVIVVPMSSMLADASYIRWMLETP
jgi:hypothetical protein